MAQASSSRQLFFFLGVLFFILHTGHGLSEFDVYFPEEAHTCKARQSPEMSSPLPEENPNSRIIGPIDEKEKKEAKRKEGKEGKRERGKGEAP